MARKRAHKRPAIEDVKAANSARLLALEGVVGVGVEEDDRGEPFICVMVRSRAAQGARSVPRRLAGYRVEVLEVGRIRARVAQG